MLVLPGHSRSNFKVADPCAEWWAPEGHEWWKNMDADNHWQIDLIIFQNHMATNKNSTIGIFLNPVWSLLVLHFWATGYRSHKWLANHNHIFLHGLCGWIIFHGGNTSQPSKTALDGMAAPHSRLPVSGTPWIFSRVGKAKGNFKWLNMVRRLLEQVVLLVWLVGTIEEEVIDYQQLTAGSTDQYCHIHLRGLSINHPNYVMCVEMSSTLLEFSIVDEAKSTVFPCCNLPGDRGILTFRSDEIEAAASCDAGCFFCVNWWHKEWCFSKICELLNMTCSHCRYQI